MVHTNKVTLKNLAKTENYIQFRQTWNQYSRNWSVPKRLVKGKWVPVPKDKLALVVTKKDGYAWALWRMRQVMMKIVDMYNRKVWKVSSVQKKHVVIKGVKYSVFSFTCDRKTNSIIGGIDNTGGS